MNENEKEYKNVFRFVLTQEDVLLSEKLFEADDFNPFTRYSIDVRDILPRAISRLQKTLSRRSYDVIAEVGRVNQLEIEQEGEEMHTYNLLKYHQLMINNYPPRYRNLMRYEPKPIVQQIGNKTIRGVECKIGLYINNYTIVERQFYVDGFNPVAKQSLDIMYAVTEIADTIAVKIKRNDIRNMWDDYDLINKRGLSITQIRELPIGKREYLLRQIRI